MTRLISMLLAWAVLALSLGSALPSASLLLDGSTLLLVALLPVAAVSVSTSPVDVLKALKAGLQDDPDLPWAERQACARTLRSLGQAALASGLLLALLTVLGIFNYAAVVERAAILTAFGGLALGPAYGLVAKGFFFDPLASALEQAPQGLGEQLGQGDA